MAGYRPGGRMSGCRRREGGRGPDAAEGDFRSIVRIAEPVVLFVGIVPNDRALPVGDKDPALAWPFFLYAPLYVLFGQGPVRIIKQRDSA